MSERDRRDERAQPDPLGPRRQRRQRRDRVERRPLPPADDREVVVGAEQPLSPPLARVASASHSSQETPSWPSTIRHSRIALSIMPLRSRPCASPPCPARPRPRWLRRRQGGDESTAEGCADVEAPAAKADGGATKPSDLLDEALTYTLVFETSCGDFEITLDQEPAPDTAASLVALASDGFYDGTIFHRVVPDFVIQGGDPTGTGGGGPGYTTVDAPASGAAYTRGVVAMAKTRPNRLDERQPVLRRHRRGCPPAGGIRHRRRGDGGLRDGRADRGARRRRDRAAVAARRDRAGYRPRELSVVDARDWDRRWTDKLLHAHGEPSSVVLDALDGLAPGRALDLGCGNGRHAMWLAERGWRVTAVDFSTEALRQARERAATTASTSTGWRPISPRTSRSGRPSTSCSSRISTSPAHERAAILARAAAAVATRRDAAARRSRPRPTSAPAHPARRAIRRSTRPPTSSASFRGSRSSGRSRSAGLTELDDGTTVEAVDALVLATRR